MGTWTQTIFFDAMLMANEGMDSRLKSAMLELICKLDIKEIYDHLDWVLRIFVLVSPSCRCTFFYVGM